MIIRNKSQSGRQQNLEEIIMFSSPLVVQIPPSMQMTGENGGIYEGARSTARLLN